MPIKIVLRFRFESGDPRFPKYRKKMTIEEIIIHQKLEIVFFFLQKERTNESLCFSIRYFNRLFVR